MALSSKAVRIFAAVEVLRDNQQDVRHALATLFEPDLAKFNGQIFDSKLVANEINDQYKLGILPAVVEGFAEIFVQRGWIEKVLNGDPSAYIVKCQPTSEVPAEIREFQDRAVSLASEFREFVKEISPLSYFDRTDSELIDHLLDWLMQLDRATEGKIKAAVKSTYKVGSKIISDFQNGSEAEIVSDSAYLSARFIDHLFKKKSEHIKFLVELGEVGLITEVVRDFQRPVTAVKRTELCVYLDAPLALDFLGTSGGEAQASIEQVLHGLTSLGGKIRIFRQSIGEMQAALNAVLNRPVSHRTGATAEALRRREVLEPFVREVAVRPEAILAAKGVAIVEQNLDAFPNEHKFFSKEAVDLMYSEVGWVREDNARFHDVAISAMAMRKRTGARSADVFDVKHVVLTRNPAYTSLARRMALEFSYIGPNHVGPVIHHRQLATSIWLRAGARESGEIPRSYILAACRRILTLRRNIVERVHALKSTLTDRQAEQLELLLTVDRSTQVLMDKTLGSAAIIDSSNIGILLEEMKKAQIAELHQSSQAEIAKLKESAKESEDRIRREATDAQDALNTALGDANTQLSESQARLQVHADQIVSVIDGILKRVNKSNNRRRTIGLVIAMLFFCLMSVASYFGNVANIKIAGSFFLLSLTIGLIFQFSHRLRSKFIEPFFQARDHDALESECIELGLPFDEVISRVTYDGEVFTRVT